MFVAKMNEDFISLLNYFSREQLIELRKTNSFTCPACKEPLLLKVGKIKIPHFAHFAKSNCLAHFSEKESEIHLLGKLQLFQFFKEQYNVFLEPYLKDLQQRPDLLVHKENKKYAIEFQCSTVDIDIIKARTDNYMKHQYIPIWILQTPKIIDKKAQGLCKIQLTSFQKHFIQQTPTQEFLITYNPLQKVFYYLSNLLYLYGNSYLATVQTLPIHSQKFPFMNPKKLSFSKFQLHYSTYLTYRQKYVTNKVFISRTGVNDPLLRSVYELQLNRLELPLFLGVPTKLSQAIPIFQIEWQTALFYFLRLHNLHLQIVDIKHIKQFLRWLRQECTNNQVKAVLNYIEWLKMINITDVTSLVKHEKIVESLYIHLVAL